MKKTKRLLSTLLVLCMVLTLLPNTAFAADTDFTIEDGILTKYNGNGGDVVIPDGITSIGDGAFYECTSLSSITIPGSVTSVGEGAFHVCSNLFDISVDPENPNYASEDGVLFDKQKSTLICYPGGKSVSYAIPDGVTSIEERAFYRCGRLTNVTIPDGVTRIGKQAFWGCTSLTSIMIPDGVTSVGDETFVNCTSLTSITIPDSVTSIGDRAFVNCCLTSITIPNGITSIPFDAFGHCLSLASVTIPASVTSIENYAFDVCRDLTDVYYGGSEAQWESISIGDYNSYLRNATIHYNSTGPDTGENPEYKVYCNGGYEVFDVSLENCMKKTASTTYNPQLAHMLIAMSNSVYNMKDMEKTYDSFGFETPKLEVNPYISYTISKKELADSSTLVLVVVRGTKLTSLFEWGNNVAGYLPPNEAGQQSGFAGVASWIYNDIETILQRSVTNSDNVEFVITGFSRGAATANILAAELVDAGIPQNDIYAYTFACPDTVIITEDAANKYQCIINIGDACDFVSWSPSGSLEGKFSDWSKYGRSYWYSDIWDDFENLEMGFGAHDQVKYLGYLRQEKSIAEYKMRDEAKTALDKAADKQSEQFWTNIKNGGRPQIVETITACPVDIEIYASGQLVGSITSNLAEVNDESKVYISVINDEKYVYLLADDTYTFNL